MLQFRIRPSANREVGVNWRPNDRTMAQDVERESQGERERERVQCVVIIVIPLQKATMPYNRLESKVVNLFLEHRNKKLEPA